MHVRTKIASGVAACLAAATLTMATGFESAEASVQALPKAAAAAPATYSATLKQTFDAFDARQGVAVDGKYFYAVNNQTITKHDKVTGKPLLQFVGDSDGPIIHMDSATVVGHKLYAATSNYNVTPEKSSVEVFDTRTMKHIDTFSFGIYRGSLTWLDRHDGAWWAAFANYDKPPHGLDGAVRQDRQHPDRQARRPLPGHGVLDAAAGAPRQGAADEQFRRLVGARRPPVDHRP